LANALLTLGSVDSQINWHAIPAEEATGLLESDPASGLTQAGDEARLRQFGPNQMTAQKRLSAWMRFLLQFHQSLIYIPLGSAAVSGFFAEWVDASVIFGVVFLNAIIGYIQEAKAEDAIGARRRWLLPTLRCDVTARSCESHRRNSWQATWRCCNPATVCRPICGSCGSAVCGSRRLRWLANLFRKTDRATARRHDSRRPHEPGLRRHAGHPGRGRRIRHWRSD
jgi:hypothetical protein